MRPRWCYNTSTMSLSKDQRRFSRCVGLLIQHAYEQGYELTFGDAYRDPRSHGAMGERIAYGSKNSNHKRRLAVDFNLFINGKYQASTEAHRPLGEWWEQLGVDNGYPLRWGGRFNDGNHYEWNR